MTSMFDALTDREVRTARNVLKVAGFAFVVVVVSGIWMLLTNEVDPFIAEQANNDGPTPLESGLADPAQDIHVTFSVLFGAITLASIAWTMFSPSFSFPKPLAYLFVLLVVASVTGPMIRFWAVELDGVFPGDVKGYWFVFDPALGDIVQTSGSRGPWVFRVAVVLHVVVFGGLSAWLMGRLTSSAFDDGFYRRGTAKGRG